MPRSVITGENGNMFRFSQEISIGHILTTVTIFLSIAGLLISWHKDRQLKKKEYADRIRRAAALTTAKLERWRELALRFFEDIQPILTDADIKLTTEGNIIATRDFLWRNLVAIRAESSRRIVDEQIEIAYVDLYGYDPRVQELYQFSVRKLKEIDHDVSIRVLDFTQADVLKLKDTTGEFKSAELGNSLRLTIGRVALTFEYEINQILSIFRTEMIKIIEARDNDIVNKRIELMLPEQAFRDFDGSNFLDESLVAYQSIPGAKSGLYLRDFKTGKALTLKDANKHTLMGRNIDKHNRQSND
jgi:hypothetical protein